MPWMAAAAVVGSSLINRNAAKSQASAQEASARYGADTSVLKPVGIKTGLGSTTFGYETLPSGVERLSSAEYQLDPRLLQLQEMQYGIPADVLSKGFGLLSQQYAPTQAYADQLRQLSGQLLPGADTAAEAQRIASEQYALMDPQRQREEQRLGASVFGRGRAGLSVGSMGQPELFGLSQARAEQDARIAANAMQQARTQRAEDIAASTGLFGTAGQVAMTPFQQLQSVYQPYNTALAGITGIEDIGRGLFNTSVGLGGGDPTGAQLLSQGFSNAAATRGQAQQDFIRQMGTLANKAIDQWKPSSLPGYSQYQYSTQGPSGMTQQQLLDQQMAGFN